MCDRDPKPSSRHGTDPLHSGDGSAMSVALRSCSTVTASASGHAAANSRPPASADRRWRKLVMTFANPWQVVRASSRIASIAMRYSFPGLPQDADGLATMRCAGEISGARTDGGRCADRQAPQRTRRVWSGLLACGASVEMHMTNVGHSWRVTVHAASSGRRGRGDPSTALSANLVGKFVGTMTSSHRAESLTEIAWPCRSSGTVCGVRRYCVGVMP